MTEPLLKKQSKKHSAEIRQKDLHCWKAESIYEHLEDTTKQRWIIYPIFNIYEEEQLELLKSQVQSLGEEIIKHQQDNTKYLFILRGQKVVNFTHNLVQPVYRVFYSPTILAKLEHQTTTKREDGQRLELLGKIYDYYLNNPKSSPIYGFTHLHLFTYDNTGSDSSDMVYSRLSMLPMILKMLMNTSFNVESVPYKMLFHLVDQGYSKFNEFVTDGYEDLSKRLKGKK